MWFVLYRGDICDNCFDASIKTDDNGNYSASVKFFIHEKNALKFVISLIDREHLATSSANNAYTKFAQKWLSISDWKALSKEQLFELWNDYLDLEGRENNHFTYGTCNSK